MTLVTRAGNETRLPASSVNSRVTGPSGVVCGLDVHASVRSNAQAMIDNLEKVRDNTARTPLREC
jgi:hypothetical protein